MDGLSFEAMEEIYLRAFPGSRFVTQPEPLTGGYINEVWRLFGPNGTCILKHAPYHVSAVPDLALDPGRIGIEAHLLAMFAEDGELADIAQPEIRPPRPYYFDSSSFTLVMEDVAPHIPFDSMARRSAVDVSVGRRLGKFVGLLHRRSHGCADFMRTIDNRSVQAVRRKVQYDATAALLASAGIDDPELPAHRAEELGCRYLEPGKCLIMGDLWPRSILVDAGPNTVRLIDWEFAHFGRPAQDVAHLAAHIWMMAHRAADKNGRASLVAAWDAFVCSYRESLGREYE